MHCKYLKEKKGPQTTQKEIEEVEQLEVSCSAGGSVNWFSALADSLVLPGKVEDVHVVWPRSPAPAPVSWRSPCARMPGRVHQTLRWPNPAALLRCPPTVAWTNKSKCQTAAEE